MYKRFQKYLCIFYSINRWWYLFFLFLLKMNEKSYFLCFFSITMARIEKWTPRKCISNSTLRMFTKSQQNTSTNIFFLNRGWPLKFHMNNILTNQQKHKIHKKIISNPTQKLIYLICLPLSWPRNSLFFFLNSFLLLLWESWEKFFVELFLSQVVSERSIAIDTTLIILY